MAQHEIIIEDLYSKGIIDREVGKRFVVIKPYLSYTHYRYFRLKPHLIYVYYKHKLIGLAYIENIEKIFVENISQDDLIVPKEEFIRSFRGSRATKVTFRWTKVLQTKNKKVFI